MNYERSSEFNKAYPEDRYQITGYGIGSDGIGLAWSILGYETEPDEDTEWSGYEVTTGNIVAVMVGDDHLWSLDPHGVDIVPLDDDEYCSCCGQVGCRWA